MILDSKKALTEIEESANIGPRLETQIISFGSFKDAWNMCKRLLANAIICKCRINCTGLTFFVDYFVFECNGNEGQFHFISRMNEVEKLLTFAHVYD